MLKIGGKIILSQNLEPLTSKKNPLIYFVVLFLMVRNPSIINHKIILSRYLCEPGFQMVPNEEFVQVCEWNGEWDHRGTSMGVCERENFFQKRKFKAIHFLNL